MLSIFGVSIKFCFYYFLWSYLFCFIVPIRTIYNFENSILNILAVIIINAFALWQGFKNTIFKVTASKKKVIYILIICLLIILFVNTIILKVFKIDTYTIILTNLIVIINFFTYYFFKLRIHFNS